MFVSSQERNSALGNFLNQNQKQYYTEMIKLYQPMTIPNQLQWLALHGEEHQTYSKYRLPYYNEVTPQRNVIYFQLFSKMDQVFLQKLKMFVEAFYLGLTVKYLHVQNGQKLMDAMKQRYEPYGHQHLAQQFLAYMQKTVPNDAYCVMGFTLKDIYPGEKWDWVYGWAMYKARVGIFSFIRLDEAFFNKITQQINWDVMLYPSMRVVVHEVGHMFAVTHCVYYQCLMSGFDTMQENYRRPFQFCPICYRKLITNVKFNPKIRYQGLIKCLNHFREKGLENVLQMKMDIEFYQKLLAIANSPLKPKKNTGKWI